MHSSGSGCGAPSEQRQDVVGQEPGAWGDRVAAAEAVLVGADEPQRLNQMEMRMKCGRPGQQRGLGTAPAASRVRTRFPGSWLAPTGSDPKEDVRVFSLIVLAQFVPSFEVARADDRRVLPVPVITTVPDDARGSA